MKDILALLAILNPLYSMHAWIKDTRVRSLTCPTVIDSEMVKIANKMKLVGKLLRKKKMKTP